MPFNVTSAARFERHVKIKFNQETLEVYYNAGEKYREYQIKAQQLDEEFSDLQRRFQRAASNMRPADTDADEDQQDEAEAVYEERKAALNGARRRIADNLCTIITKWDLEDDLDIRLDAIYKKHGVEVFLKAIEDLKAREYPSDGTRTVTIMVIKKGKEVEEKREIPAFGVATIPIDGLWTDILPLPDEFILDVVEAITKNFESGGAGGKGRLKVS
jgi:hypothetical protein